MFIPGVNIFFIEREIITDYEPKIYNFQFSWKIIQWINLFSNKLITNSWLNSLWILFQVGSSEDCAWLPVYSWLVCPWRLSSKCLQIFISIWAPDLSCPSSGGVFVRWRLPEQEKSLPTIQTQNSFEKIYFYFHIIKVIYTLNN